MANSAMVRSNMSVQHPIIPPNLTTLLQDPQKRKTPFAGRQPATVGGMEGFRKALKGEGVSKLPATLIINSRRSGSISNYQSA